MPETPPLPDQTPIAVARPVTSPTYAAAATPPPSPLELVDLPRREAGLDLALVLLVAVLVPFAPDAFARLMVEEIPLPQIGSFVILLKWADALLVCGLAAYLLLRHRRSPAAFGIRGDRFGRQLLWGAGTLVGAYAYMACTAVVVFGFMGFFPEIQEDLKHRAEFADKLPVESVAASILLLIPVAIHEEVLFRGLLLPYLRRLTGCWWLAIAISSIIFGLLHLSQGWLGALQIVGLAAVLSACFLLSRSLVAVTIAHFAFDFLQFQLIRLIPDLDEWMQQG
jgi:membrane protease YdiL (CAAX protease family)